MRAYKVSGPRAVLVLCAAVAVSVAFALAGLAHAQEPPEAPPPESPTLRVLRSTPRHVSDLDEDDDERDARLREIAEAIDAATPRPQERALLLAKGVHESWWASYIHHDLPKCRDGHGGKCDGGKSWSFWQLQNTDRTGGVHGAARIAISRLRYYATLCGGETLEERVERAFAHFATGNSCEWSGAAERVQTWKSILARM